MDKTLPYIQFYFRPTYAVPKSKDGTVCAVFHDFDRKIGVKAGVSSSDGENDLHDPQTQAELLRMVSEELSKVSQ